MKERKYFGLSVFVILVVAGVIFGANTAMQHLYGSVGHASAATTATTTQQAGKG